jgi:hypothetical protein
MADIVASGLLRQLHIHYGRMEDSGARTLTSAKHSLAQQSTNPRELTAKTREGEMCLAKRVSS